MLLFEMTDIYTLWYSSLNYLRPNVVSCCGICISCEFEVPVPLISLQGVFERSSFDRQLPLEKQEFHNHWKGVSLR